jgi:diphthine-ammonia ligase
MWSGGKDSYLAYQAAISQGYVIPSLVNFEWVEDEVPKPGFAMRLMTSVLSKVARKKWNYKYVPHDVNADIIAVQAQALGLPIVQDEVSWKTFEQQFTKTIKNLGVEGVVWGAEGGQANVHVDMLRPISEQNNIKMIIPLDGRSEEENLKDFMQESYEATIIVVDSDLLSEDWLGRKVDADFLAAIHKSSKESGVDVSNVEFHTLTTDAPLFKKRIKIIKSTVVAKKGFSVLDISNVELVEKTKTIS